MTEKQALQKMKDDILLRGLSESTFRNYSYNVKSFFAFCNRPIEELDENDVRIFLEHLIVKRKLAPRTVNQHSAAIRFFFAVGLNRHMNYLQIPLMKIPKALPDILTRDEINNLISVCANAKHKALLLLAYGSGLRAGEIGGLRVKDIDSKEMRVFVKGGKNKIDHYTILSQTALDALREYWKIFRPNNPQGYLFPGMKYIGHITRAAVALAFENCIARANIDKEVSPHSLRRAFATHLLEDGVELIKIKEFLGHSRIQSTMAYLRLLDSTKGIKSPADGMAVSTE
jgi:site-specific recombinase XerD